LPYGIPPQNVSMAVDIHKASVRNELVPRREPYCGPPLDTGRHLGVRKLENGACVWIARLRDDDGDRHYRSLGQVTKDFEHGPAKRAAEAWFATFDAGVTDKPPTVADACREYVASLEGATGKAQPRRVTGARIRKRYRVGEPRTMPRCVFGASCTTTRSARSG
jgi:hypothetical protein